MASVIDQILEIACLLAIGGIDETQTTQTLECQLESRGCRGLTQGRVVGKSESADWATSVCASVIDGELPEG